MGGAEQAGGGAVIHALRRGAAEAELQLWAPDLRCEDRGAALDEATAEMLRDWQAWKAQQG